MQGGPKMSPAWECEEETFLLLISGHPVSLSWPPATLSSYLTPAQTCPATPPPAPGTPGPATGRRRPASWWGTTAGLCPRWGRGRSTTGTAQRGPLAGRGEPRTTGAPASSSGWPRPAGWRAATFPGGSGDNIVNTTATWHVKFEVSFMLKYCLIRVSCYKITFKTFSDINKSCKIGKILFYPKFPSVAAHVICWSETRNYLCWFHYKLLKERRMKIII